MVPNAPAADKEWAGGVFIKFDISMDDFSNPPECPEYLGFIDTSSLGA